MDRNTQTIIMDTITKELFDNYLKLQRSGIMNMTDIEQGAIILNTEGRFHRTTIDKIWVEKEDMPTTK